MDNENRLPIETSREGDKITKVCVEDVYKIINRLNDAINRSLDKTRDVTDFVEKEYVTEDGDTYTGSLIIGKGTSKPCEGDTFDEEVGNRIAFMKAKLNANIKKHNFLCRIYNAWIDAIDSIDDEICKIDNLILLDLFGIRIYNPEYLPNIELTLGIDNMFDPKYPDNDRKLSDWGD